MISNVKLGDLILKTRGVEKNDLVGSIIIRLKLERRPENPIYRVTILNHKGISDKLVNYYVSCYVKEL